MVDWKPDTRRSPNVWRCTDHGDYLGRVARDPFAPTYTVFDASGKRLGREKSQERAQRILEQAITLKAARERENGQ